MRIAIYGGSFNPPHIAHAMVASWVLWTGRAEQVWLLPVYHHAFEGLQSKRLAPFPMRVEWCEIMAREIDPRIVVSTIESELPTPSYTIDTLRALRQRHPEHSFRLVIGADVLPQLPQWRSWDEIEQEFGVIVVGRQGHPLPESHATIQFPSVSSTEIREHRKAKKAISHLLTAGVHAALDTADWHW